MSEIERVHAIPHFKPYSGSDADMIFEEVRKQVKKSITDEQVRRAVESLGIITGREMEKTIEIQDKFCDNCGLCCRLNNPIDFQKYELQIVAKRLGTSYGKLKRKLGARWSGRTHVWDVPAKPCPFLKGMNYCTIYDIRPLACRLYPFGKPVSQVIRGELVEITRASECSSVKGVIVSIAVARLMDEHVGEQNED